MSAQQHTKWISPNTELLFMIAIGLGTTAMENSQLNVKETLSEIWGLQFSEINIPVPFENVLKSMMSGIVLARAFSVHIYLASYLLLIYPVIKEKMRVMLVFWLALSALRSILVNGSAALIGLLFCSAQADLKPVCFEFSAVKALELACSVYMWVNVHDFYYALKKGKTNPVNTRRHKPAKVVKKDLEASSSDFTVDLSKDLLAQLSGSSLESSASVSEQSLSEQLKAIEWFMKHVPGFRDQGQLEVTENVMRFLEMPLVQVAALQEKLRKRTKLRKSAQLRKSKGKNEGKSSGTRSIEENQKEGTEGGSQAEEARDEAKNKKQLALEIKDRIPEAKGSGRN